MLQIHENAMPHKGYTALDKKMRDIYKMPVEYNNLHQKERFFTFASGR